MWHDKLIRRLRTTPEREPMRLFHTGCSAFHCESMSKSHTSLNHNEICHFRYENAARPIREAATSLLTIGLGLTPNSTTTPYPCKTSLYTKGSLNHSVILTFCSPKFKNSSFYLIFDPSFNL